MVLDYRERRQVNKNRPKNRPVKLIFFFVLGVVLAIYSLGVTTGWFLYKAFVKTGANAGAPVAAADTKRKTNDAPLPDNKASNSSKNTEPPLTFYYTLPKGEKMALGSGLNPAREYKPGSADHTAPQTANTKQMYSQVEQPQKNVASEQHAASPGRASVAGKSGDHTGMSGASDKEPSDKTAALNKSETSRRRYTVQVASCNTKKEAETIKSSLDRMGLLSHVVETKVPGKGTWYRVRLGSQLDFETAGKIAAKAGKSAIVILE